MKKRVLILILVIIFIVTASGCSTGSQQDGAKNGNKPIELIWIMGDPGKVPVDQAKVEEKLNEISIPAINVTVKTLYYNDEKTKLALSSGEKFDMVFTSEWFNNFAVQAQAGYFADITDKVKELTPKLYETMPEVVWDGAKINGKIYAIPVKKDYAAEIFWRFDKALFVDELKMEVKDKMDFFEVEPFLKAAKDAWKAGNKAAANAEYPLKLTKAGLSGIDSSFDMINRDVMLGIPYSAIGTADENKIVITYEHPDLTDRLTALHKWYNAGFINKDAATVEDVGKYSAVKNGQGFYGADAIWSGGDGFTQVISKYSGPYLSTASIRGSMNAISASSKNIDAALKLQELINTNQEYRDILRYGVPGVHWNKNEKGLAVKTQLGRDNYGPWPFSQGSYSLSTVEASEGVEADPDMWNKIFDGYKDLKATKSIGFAFDITNVSAQVAAVKVVADKYKTGLNTGTLDPATTLPKMMKELEAAGIRDIQKEAQKQYDAYIAGK
ncbi:ABC transporter substrate-binding protein [Paenibacillus thermotolerans]|uniref:ABC transporter substrate-binding protein n=1 Tax=Paenibacillus thermotolerans TaxID=3027807 RepID=UPI002368EF46|nr:MULTISPECIES: ABC transporter substrate-binding protein [unclassified Paenibacillus]